MLRTQRHRWIGNRARLRQHLDAKVACERREQQHGLHLCEGLADAETRPAAERKIRVAMERLRKVTLPALGPKRIRIREPSRVALDGPWAKPHLCSARHEVATDLDVFAHLASHRPCGWIEAQ